MGLNVYDRRWNNAKQLFERLQLLAKEQNCFVVFDNDFETDEIEINEDDRTINFVGDHCSVNVYNGDPEYDEGANSTIQEWNDEMRSRIRVFKEIDLKL
jgi:hypothetical protein